MKQLELKLLKNNSIGKKEETNDEKEYEQNTEDTSILINKEEKDEEKPIYNKDLSKKDILIKSSKISLKNWRKSVCRQIDLLITQIFSLYIPILKANLIDAIATNQSYGEMLKIFKKYMLYLSLKFIVKIIFGAYEFFFIKKYTDDYKNILFEKIIEKDISFFDVYKTGELVNKIKECEENVNEDFIFTTLSHIQKIIKLISMAFYLFKSSFELTLIFCVIFAIQLVVDYGFENYSTFRNFREKIGFRDQYSNKLTELISNIRMIKSFGKETDEVKKIEALKLKGSFDFDFISHFLFNASDFFKNGGESLTLLFTGKYILSNKFSLGKFTVFKQYQKEFIDCYEDLKRNIKKYAKLFSQWKVFFELYDYPILIKSNKNYIPEKLNGEIKFQNVTFSYPLNHKSIILKNLSFTIEPGKIFAICGFSGSGKTTISNLIQRFYDPNDGKITLDNIDLKDYNIRYLRNNIGFVAQEPILNSGTIEENIIYGVDSYKKDDFEEVLKLSNINSFVNNKNLFPEGLKTLVGERGVKVSGGQKQRIAIARALMKNSKILVFDEATSALDAESEAEVQKAIENIAKKKDITIVIIAHRLSTIINADTIAVLNKGNIVEFGNHKELIEKDGEYKKLFQKQLFSNNNKVDGNENPIKIEKDLNEEEELHL